LVFTPAVALKETGNNLEVTGIRVIKYPIDYTSGDNSDNDYVLYRYSDVLLMKAEAILRGGTPTAVAPVTPLALVNAVRARVSATALPSVNLDQLSDERGREFYWEGMRRTDMIRFGKFLGPRILKAGTSDSKYLLFPIPNEQLAVNPNLVQNPGY
jgi:starch-binding outer membrane protein, SusD/RagB family